MAKTPLDSSRLSKVTISQPTSPRPRRPTDNCTHRHVTRVWDKYDRLKCSCCGKNSQFGFFYRCTADSAGNLLDTDFTKINRFESLQIDSHRPSTSSEKFVAEKTSTLSSPINIGLSTNGPAKSSVKFALNNIVAGRKQPALPENSQKSDPSTARGAAFTIPACDFKVCPKCRPIYRDRAWQSIDTIVNESVKPPSQLELNNRPMSRPSVLAGADYSRGRGRRAKISERLVRKGSSTSRSLYSLKEEDEEDDEATGHRPSPRLPRTKTYRNLNSSLLNPRGPGHDGSVDTNARDNPGTPDISFDPANNNPGTIEPNQSTFFQTPEELTAYLTTPRNRSSLINSRSLYDESRARSTTLVLDTANREQRTNGRKLRKGRFYID